MAPRSVWPRRFKPGTTLDLDSKDDGNIIITFEVSETPLDPKTFGTRLTTPNQLRGIRVRSRGGPPERFEEVGKNAIFPADLIAQWKKDRELKNRHQNSENN